ncbi:hypothetical protein CASFOL_002400 [Castilleja foliolosa]|uniref:Homeobox domain-containing protein n=1 Tax=Castilleja foliolosa TaxID=1961234 RepID=A0ABD3EHQ2_9LAMI
MSCMAGTDQDEKSRHIISSAAYSCYSDASSNPVAHLHNFGPSGPEIYTGAMENLIGFPPKNHHIQNGPVSSWKGFFTRPETGPSSSPSPQQTINHETEYNYQHDLTEMFDAGDPSRSSCVFTCEGLERPSHGLSLSLNPSSIGLQSFELRQQQDGFVRFGPSSSRSMDNNNNSNLQQYHAYIRHSMYLGPAKELLIEFCNLGIKTSNYNSNMKAIQKNSEWQDKLQSLYSLDLVDLQRRKKKLIHMLEEVDRRYKHYCDNMRSVVSTFESLTGHGAASTYSALASKAMSRHFRCLKDGILSQIKATKKAMGEKDMPGSIKGETPRLRVLDQTLRQQRALQQISNMEIHPWRPQRGLPERSVSVLRAWLFEHFLHPYPSDVDKHILARQTGLSRSQVSNWFINARVRIWKPMVEEMYLEELKEDQTPNPNPDQKPTHDQLIRIESEYLSPIIINHSDKNDDVCKNPNFGRIGDSFGDTEFSFSSYGNHSGGGVSLTLGLPQHGGGSMNLQFSQAAAAAAAQGSLFYMDGHEAQNLPYRNLMGAQLLHDLAG